MSSQEPAAGGAGARAGVPRWLYVVAPLVLVVGLALAVVGWMLYSDARAESDVAAQRDEVTDVASQVIINAFSFDHRNVDQSLENLSGVSTGDFLAEQEQWSAEVRDRVVEQKAVTTATVSNTAVSTLDLDAGEASVLVVFTAHSEREGQDTITGRQAMRVDLLREEDAWKASAVEQVGVTVPVGESSRSVQELQDPAAGAEPDEDTDPAGDAGGADEPTEPAPSRGGR